jgi:hypothetical protein
MQNFGALKAISASNTMRSPCGQCGVREPLAAGPVEGEGFGGEVGDYEVAGARGGRQKGFGGQVAAADCAFHGGGPTSFGPIAG